MQIAAMIGAGGHVRQRLIEHLEALDWCGRILDAGTRETKDAPGKLI
jgi:hypothetical protein